MRSTEFLTKYKIYLSFCLASLFKMSRIVSVMLSAESARCIKTMDRANKSIAVSRLQDSPDCRRLFTFLLVKLAPEL